jgi:hypothetical protein
MVHAHAPVPVHPHARPTLKRRLMDLVFRRGVNPGMLRIAGRRWSPWAIVRHVGRRSGRAYATPVILPRVDGENVRTWAYRAHAADAALRGR